MLGLVVVEEVELGIDAFRVNELIRFDYVEYSLELSLLWIIEILDDGDDPAP